MIKPHGNDHWECIYVCERERNSTYGPNTYTRVHITTQCFTLHNIPRRILGVSLLWPYNLLDELGISMARWPSSFPSTFLPLQGSLPISLSDKIRKARTIRKINPSLADIIENVIKKSFIYISRELALVYALIILL